MALLNPPSVVPELGFVACRQLLRSDRELAWKDLHRRISPGSATRSAEADPFERGISADPLNVTLRSLRDIGLMDLEEGQVRLTAKYGGAIGSLAEDREHYRQALTTGIMDSADASAEWNGKSEASLPGSTDLGRSLAWWVLQSPELVAYWPTRTTPAALRNVGLNVEESIATDLIDRSEDGQVIHNQERWQAFKRWSTYLGFSTSASPALRAKAKGQFIAVNPAGALRRAIGEIESGRHSFDSFFEQLTKLLPVLPGGSLSKVIESHFSPEIIPGFREVPTALSYALVQLEQTSGFSLDHESDAESAWILRLPAEGHADSGIKTRLVSDVHI